MKPNDALQIAIESAIRARKEFYSSPNASRESEVEPDLKIPTVTDSVLERIVTWAHLYGVQSASSEKEITSLIFTVIDGELGDK